MPAIAALNDALYLRVARPTAPLPRIAPVMTGALEFTPWTIQDTGIAASSVADRCFLRS